MKFNLDFFAARWKVFVLSLVLQLLITALLRLGIKAPSALSIFAFPSFQTREASVGNLRSPAVENSETGVQSERVSILKATRPQLEQKQNSFRLQKDDGVILSTAQANEGGNFDQSSGYAVVDFDSGKVLASKNLEDKLAIASITKVMTAVVALDLTSPEEEFVVSENAALIPPTKIGVVAGEKMKLEDLLQALLLTSANDAAEVIKEGVDQRFGEGAFIASMNEKARILELKNTHFQNPQGFDGSRHYSSAEDLAILSHYALTNYSLISSIVKKDYQLLQADTNHKQFDLYNWNGLIGVYPGAYGIKIGNTDSAGYTTTVVAERPSFAEVFDPEVSDRRASAGKDGKNEVVKKRVLVVLLGAPGILERDLWASQLLDIGFAKLGIPAAQVSEESLRAKYASWKYWG